MAQYALIKDGFVHNAIIADEDENQIQVLKMFYPELDDVILETEATGTIWVNGTFVNGKFRRPKPYPSWVWDDVTSAWTSPIPYSGEIAPNISSSWNEENQAWDVFEIEVQPMPNN